MVKETILPANLMTDADQSPDSPKPENDKPAEDRFPTRFKPGQSGNPAGRPKRSEEEKEVLEKIRDLAPKAVEMLSKIIAPDSKASPYAKLQAIDIILNRTLGKPESSVKLTTAAQSVEASEARIAALISRIRIEGPES